MPRQFAAAANNFLGRRPTTLSGRTTSLEVPQMESLGCNAAIELHMQLKNAGPI